MIAPMLTGARREGTDFAFPAVGMTSGVLYAVLLKSREALVKVF